MPLADLRDELETFAVRQAHVGEAQRVGMAREQVARLREIAGAVDVQAHADQGQLEQLAQVGLVVHDQHPGHARSALRFAHPPSGCATAITKAVRWPPGAVDTS